MSPPVRVAIIGGGCAAMAAAFEITKPRGGGPLYEVTVYQMGHRLGGKGASGRGKFGRIEEHGLHLWMGYYENSFRLMRECYAELNRDPEACPIAKWSDAFSPANYNALVERSPRGGFRPWIVEFPASKGLPGDPEIHRWTIPEYLARAASLVGLLLNTVREDGDDARSRRALFPEFPDDRITGETLLTAARRLVRYGTAVGLGALLEAVSLLEFALRRAPLLPQAPLAWLVDAIDVAVRNRLDALTRRDDEARRLWEVIDLMLAAIRGSIRFRLALDPAGFDAIDEYDSREWLLLNGASRSSIDSAVMRGLYDLAFAYEDGNPRKPKIAAGIALRGAFRAFLTYRGAFFWKMTAGMGDIVFAPLYEVLKRRGVRFEFFHKLTNIGLAKDSESAYVSTLDFDVQANVRAGGEYRPLIEVGGLPSWPSEPDFEQLEDGRRLMNEHWDLESQWDSRRVGTKTLSVGEDFDAVVLGVGAAVVPHVCKEILRSDERWRDMVAHVKTVGTQAFQIWMRTKAAALGWRDEPVNLSGFVEPFDTWADMTHLARREAWPEPPGNISYFCSVLPEDDPPADLASWEDAARLVHRRRLEVRDNAVKFLDGRVVGLWPSAHRAGRFRWDVLLSTSDREEEGSSVFESQFWTANVRPSDRYTQSLPGTTRYRISPLDRTYDNMTIAGDWTHSGLNMGCVEAATMSGLLASHAITGFPQLSDVVGYDHP